MRHRRNQAFAHTNCTFGPRSCRSVRQFDSVRVFLVALVFFTKNLFEPTCLFFSNPLIRECRIVTNDKFLATAITSERSHFLEIREAFSRLCPFFICNSLHLHSPKGLRGQVDVHCCVEPSPSDLGTRGVVNLRRKTAGLRHSNNYFIPEASETFPQWLVCRMAYYWAKFSVVWAV